MSLAASIRKKATDKIEGLRRLSEWMRTLKNWRAVWKYQRQKEHLPPFELRNGVVLHHGPYDSPALLLDEVWVKQWYEIGRLPPADALMLDVGANIGSVSLYWAHKSPAMRVHCYEPNPAAVITLRRNIAANALGQRAEIFAEGVGRTAGSLKLWVDVPTDLSTGYMDSSPAEGGKRIEVPVVGIDEAWRRLGNKKIWLLKVDTEGAEVDILEGASASFLAAVENTIVEYHDNIVPGSFARARVVLEGAGFKCQFLHHPWKEGIIYGYRNQA